MKITLTIDAKTAEEIEILQKVLENIPGAIEQSQGIKKPTAPAAPQAPIAPAAPQAPIAPQAPAAPQTPIAPQAPAAQQAPIAPQAPAAPQAPQAQSSSNTAEKRDQIRQRLAPYGREAAENFLKQFGNGEGKVSTLPDNLLDSVLAALNQ